MLPRARVTGAHVGRLGNVVAVVVLGEGLAIKIGRERVGVAKRDAALLNPAHALVEVGDPADLSELAVVDDVDSGVDLLLDDIAHG